MHYQKELCFIFIIVTVVYLIPVFFLLIKYTLAGSKGWRLQATGTPWQVEPKVL
jgi:hypothetical protein